MASMTRNACEACRSAASAEATRASIGGPPESRNNTRMMQVTKLAAVAPVAVSTSDSLMLLAVLSASGCALPDCVASLSPPGACATGLPIWPARLVSASIPGMERSGRRPLPRDGVQYARSVGKPLLRRIDELIGSHADGPEQHQQQ